MTSISRGTEALITLCVFAVGCNSSTTVEGAPATFRAYVVGTVTHASGAPAVGFTVRSRGLLRECAADSSQRRSADGAPTYVQTDATGHYRQLLIGSQTSGCIEVSVSPYGDSLPVLSLIRALPTVRFDLAEEDIAVGAQQFDSMRVDVRLP